MLRLRLLGSFELKGPGDRTIRITARKTRALLAFLALQNGAPQSRERLAALLWEDADAELARSSLRQALTATSRRSRWTSMRCAPTLPRRRSVR
jgi:DNA-binding SARP family transcriptional activator